MAERAAIVTGASSGIGLAIARVLGEEGYGLTVAARRPEKLEAAAEGCAATGFEVEAVAGQRRRRGGRSRRSSPPTASASGASTCSSTTPASGIGAPVAEIETKQLDMQLDINLRSIVLFYRECDRRCCEAAGAEHQQRARGQHVVDLGQARRGVAVGLLRDQARRRRLHRGDEQGARQRGHQVDRAVPGVRRHADDRLRQGPGRRRRR